MCKLMFGVISFILVFSSYQRSFGDELRAVIARAIKAHGGEEKFAKQKAGITKSKGTIHLLGGIEFTSEVFSQLPNKFREVSNLEIMGMKITVATTYNGAKAWIVAGDKTMDADEKILEEIREHLHMGKVARLIHLKDKEFELAALGESKIEEQTAIGIRVSSKGHKDVNIFFDKATGLVAKIERRAVDPTSGKEFSEERIIKDYQEIEGLKTIKKLLIKRDGAKYIDLEVTEIKLVDKHDDSLFEKP